MPTIITFLLAPICVVMAVYRLVAIPWQMLAGQRHLCTRPSALPALWAGVAYVALLGYLLWLCVRVYNGFASHHTEAAEVLRLVLYFEAFPVVYVLAESRFFYGFERAARTAVRGPVQGSVSLHHP
jgi:hypothetical protein